MPCGDVIYLVTLIGKRCSSDSEQNFAKIRLDLELELLFSLFLGLDYQVIPELHHFRISYHGAGLTDLQ